MPRTAEPAVCPPFADYNPEQEMLALSEQTLRVIRTANALAVSARPVDLEGLDRQIGLLCAKALDLPLGQTGFAKLELRRLVRGLDALTETMRNDTA